MWTRPILYSAKLLKHSGTFWFWFLLCFGLVCSILSSFGSPDLSLFWVSTVTFPTSAANEKRWLLISKDHFISTCLYANTLIRNCIRKRKNSEEPIEEHWVLVTFSRVIIAILFAKNFTWRSDPPWLLVKSSNKKITGSKFPQLRLSMINFSTPGRLWHKNPIWLERNTLKVSDITQHSCRNARFTALILFLLVFFSILRPNANSTLRKRGLHRNKILSLARDLPALKILRAAALVVA